MMTQIYNKLYNKLLCTDISAVYDTIEHDILYWKLDHSYLKIENSNSNLTALNHYPVKLFKEVKWVNCSIIYINELPLLFNLLKNAEFNRNYNIWKIMDHITVQFVNDGSNVWTLYIFDDKL